METKWQLEIEAEAGQPQSYVIRLRVKGVDTAPSVDLIAPCRTVEQFERGIDRLIEELKQLPGEARTRTASLGQAGGAPGKAAPQAVWKQMENFATEAEMFAFFNSFVEAQRQEIADYVFAHVNMFKGRGPVFSEHYDSTSHLLE